MQITSYKTHKISVNESITFILDRYLPQLTEGSIVAIASKIVSLSENNVVAKTQNKFALIEQEAEKVFVNPHSKHGFYLTLKQNRLIPNAGLDESNVDNLYVFYPKKPQQSAANIWHYLRQRNNIEKLGIIITDSNVTPLRRGVIGIAVGWCGFEPIYNYIGSKDLFARPLEVTTINLLDSLATAATLVMGEGAEQTPLAVIQNPPKIEFCTEPPAEEMLQQVSIAFEEDLFGPILSNTKE